MGRVSTTVTPLGSEIDRAVSAQPGMVAHRLPVGFRERTPGVGSIHQLMLTTVSDR